MGDDALTDAATGDAAGVASSGCWDADAPDVASAGHAAGVTKGAAAPSSTDDGGIAIGLDFVSEEVVVVPVPARPTHECMKSCSQGGATVRFRGGISTDMKGPHKPILSRN